MARVSQFCITPIHLCPMPFQWVERLGRNTLYSYSIDRNKEKPGFWEIVFIVLASAFTLEEYTHANENGWIS
jgi:hypothetical protein